MGELDVTFGGYSTSGTKDENEDAFAACQPSAGTRRRKGVVAGCISTAATTPVWSPRSPR